MASRNDWWHARREELLDLAREKTPLYVYNEETLNETVFDLLSIQAVDRLFYPVHINSHLKVLEKIYEMDVGFTCISTDEMAGLLKLFSKMKPQRLLFIPDSDISEEYEYAFQLGIHVVVGNLFSLKACQDIFQNREIFIRLDITHDQGRGLRSILFSEMETLLGLLRAAGTTVSGFYLNSKRRFRPSFDINGTESVLKRVLEYLPEVSTVILGDGIGVSLEPGRAVMNIPDMGDNLEAIKESYPGLKLWLDAGRYIISHAAVILTRATNSFPRKDHNCVSINLDVKSFAQNTLDESHLMIVNLSKLDHEASSLPHMILLDSKNHNRLCHAKCLAPVEEGDILLIPNVGASGSKTGLNPHQDNFDCEYYLKARKMCPVKI